MARYGCCPANKYMSSPEVTPSSSTCQDKIRFIRLDAHNAQAEASLVEITVYGANNAKYNIVSGEMSTTFDSRSGSFIANDGDTYDNCNLCCKDDSKCKSSLCQCVYNCFNNKIDSGGMCHTSDTSWWISLDLGSEKCVNSITVDNRRDDPHQKRIVGAKISTRSTKNGADLWSATFDAAKNVYTFDLTTFSVANSCSVCPAGTHVSSVTSVPNDETSCQKCDRGKCSAAGSASCDLTCSKLPNGNGQTEASKRVGSLGGIIDVFSKDWHQVLPLSGQPVQIKKNSLGKIEYDLKKFVYTEVLIRRLSKNWCDSWGRNTGKWVENDGASMGIEADNLFLYYYSNWNNNHMWVQQPLRIIRNCGGPNSDKQYKNCWFRDTNVNEIIEEKSVKIEAIGTDGSTVKITFPTSKSKLILGNFDSFVDCCGGCDAESDVKFDVYIKKIDSAKKSAAITKYGPIENWDVSEVTNMKNAFYQTTLNPDISRWDVSTATNMNSSKKL